MLRVIPLLFSILLLSCKNDDTLTSEDVQTIRYGTSFGMCAGYCLTDMEVSSGWVYLTSYGRDESVQSKSMTLDFDVRSYRDLLATVQREQFLTLDPVIGCPDCADGGAEWIEMKVDGRNKKVTFEYGKAPKGLETILSELRSLSKNLDKGL